MNKYGGTKRELTSIILVTFENIFYFLILDCKELFSRHNKRPFVLNLNQEIVNLDSVSMLVTDIEAILLMTEFGGDYFKILMTASATHHQDQNSTANIYKLSLTLNHQYHDVTSIVKALVF